MYHAWYDNIDEGSYDLVEDAVSKICGYIYNGSELPTEFTCPTCGHDASDFEPIYE